MTDGVATHPPSPAPSPALVVDVLRPEEAYAAGEVCVAAYRDAGLFHDPDTEAYAATLRDVAVRSQHAEVLVARIAGEIVGTVTLAPAGSPYADLARPGEVELRMLGVDPAAQGRGIGRALIAAAARRGRARGHAALVLSVLSADGRRAPHHLYERAGFRRVGDRDYVGEWDPAGAVMWVYRLDLARPGR